jgi:subtilisin family serine protease
VRRLTALLAALAALVLAASALASLQPVRRSFGERDVPLVRPASDVAAPTGPRAHGRIRVLVRLESQPLAAWSARRLAATGSRARLDVRTQAARSYLAALAAEQAAAASAIRVAIPSARIGRRFDVILNALDVELPASALRRLYSVAGVTRVYPSLRYTLTLNRSPGLVGATAFAGLTGARGEGMKIAIVDDGVDPANPFFDPAGYSYPEGFPRGQERFVTPKVIVAKSFPAPGTPRSSARAFDRRDTFHGTHVAGIAAGNAGTTAPPGLDHPELAGLSGVAPRAWIGNYRVFSLPTPVGNVANTPEVVAAFEAAVEDGMDVINFSGGGAQTDPANDALVEAVANVAAAGVVPVIAAGNDRDDLGEGTAGSPGTAPDAVSVAAVSDDHVFGPALSVDGLAEIPYVAAAGLLPPVSWSSEPRDIVDVSTLTGTDGTPVEPHLCSTGSDPNGRASALPPASLQGAVALVSRGLCTFVSKAERAERAGAVGIVVVDNRPGEANPIPVELPIPGLMVSDLDGAALRAHLASRGGRAPMRAGRTPFEFATGRGGVVTSFSSAGPTAFGHALKPDVAAPGGAILSSTNPSLADSPFAVFDGTSMATPHVAGVAALLLQRHPGWTPAQVKSALVSTAGRAWRNTARTSEAPVILAGSGLVNAAAADDPKVFTSPASLSFGDLNVRGHAASSRAVVALDDAGGGAGTWQVEVRAQTQTGSTWVGVPATVTVPGFLAISANAPADAEPGLNQGFVVLVREGVERRIPYLFLVTRPGLAAAQGSAVDLFVFGDTRRGTSLASAYSFPTNPFGQPPDFGRAPPMVEDGAESVFVFRIDNPVTNFGVAVESEDESALIDPFVLGSLDENDVQGFAGAPVNVNGLTDYYLVRNGAAGASFPTVGRYYVSIDSGRDEFTNRRLAGRFVVRAWVDDLFPPLVELETTTLGDRRPVVAARVFDFQSGVDPITLTLLYGDVAVGAAFYDPIDGLALFPIPAEAPPLDTGKITLRILASDYQESKNVQTVGTDVFPNTALFEGKATVETRRTVLNWLAPDDGLCVSKPSAVLLVSAEGPRKIARVRFFDGERPIKTDRKDDEGLFTVEWKTKGLKRGKHELRAVAVDAKGTRTEASRTVRVCAG